MPVRPFRVLVVEDSAVQRRALTALISSDAGLAVVGPAADGDEGLRLALTERPDAVILDLQMPRVDGFGFLRLLMAKRPTPVLVVSSAARKADVFRALELGAIDFVARPSQALTFGEVEGRELLAKLKALKQVGDKALQRVEPPRPSGQMAKRIVLIGASTGGPPAITALLGKLSADLPIAVVVAQHMPAKFTAAFAERLHRSTSFEVAEARSGDELLEGRALICPGGAQTHVGRSGQALRLRVAAGGEGRRYVPSIDALFESAASAIEGTPIEALGAILTGMGDDGRCGIQSLARAKAVTVAESESSAVIFGMPSEAIATGAVQRVLSLDAIGEALVRFARDGR